MASQYVFPQRVRDAILPRSKQKSLPAAFSEWCFGDHVEDLKRVGGCCDLCESESLRFRFLIRNGLTGQTLWSGSQCILNFKIAVVERDIRNFPPAPGSATNPVDVKRRLERALSVARHRASIAALDEAAHASNNDILRHALAYYRKNGVLTPRYAYVVLRHLDTLGIDHQASAFKVTLNGEKYQADLQAMTVNHVHVLWPALSSAQRDIARRLGHCSPSRILANGQSGSSNTMPSARVPTTTTQQHTT